MSSIRLSRLIKDRQNWENFTVLMSGGAGNSEELDIFMGTEICRQTKVDYTLVVATLQIEEAISAGAEILSAINETLDLLKDEEKDKIEHIFRIESISDSAYNDIIGNVYFFGVGENWRTVVKKQLSLEGVEVTFQYCKLDSGAVNKTKILKIVV